MNRLAGLNRLDGRLSGPPRFLAVASGKGGVGKSVISFNLADHLSRRYKVLLIDGDFFGGNLHLLANVAPKMGWQQICRDQSSTSQVVLAVNDNLHLLSSDGSFPDTRALAAFLTGLRSDPQGFDFVIFDTASGILPHTLLILHAVDEIILVTTPELTAISDAYALYKTLIGADKNIFVSLLVNREDQEEDGDYIYRKFCAMTRQFLDAAPACLGFLPHDENLVTAVASQKGVSACAPHSPVNRQLAALAENLSKGRSAVAFDAVAINSTGFEADTKE